jgi:diacylglycerol kinase (ATP)
MLVSPVRKAVMVSSVLLVLIVELLNSALEAAVDRVSLENINWLKCEDVDSAAVCTSLANVASVCALMIFG